MDPATDCNDGGPHSYCAWKSKRIERGLTALRRRRAGPTFAGGFGRQATGSAAAAAAILAATASSDDSFVLSPECDASMGLTS